MRKSFVNTVIILLSLAVLMSLFISVQLSLDRRYLSSEKSVRELMYFPSAQMVKLLSAGNQMMMADYLWLRMIQYYAFHMRSDRNFEYLYPITDNLTDLDPRFMYPYTFGSLLLVHDAQDSVNSLKLLDKAKRNNPDRWEFPYMKGFILYVFLRRSDEAVKEFLESSRLPNAWEGALRYAAWISKKEGKRETSKQMWQELYDGARSDLEKSVAKYYLDKIKLEEEMDHLQKMAEEYRRANKSYPNSLHDLISAGLINSVPKDPFNRRYYWDPVTKKVRNQTQDALLRSQGKW